MARFLQSRSCNDDFYAENLNSNSNSNSNSNNNLDELMDQLVQQFEDINVTNNKRKRPETKFYEFARALVNEGEMDAAEAEMDNDYNDYCDYTDGYAYGRCDYDYDYDENAMIQEDDEEVQDNELFQMKHELDAHMVLDDAEVDEINEDFDELQQLRSENARLREHLRQQLIPFPAGSGTRFVTVDGIQYLQVFQESMPMSIDELNCDANDDF